MIMTTIGDKLHLVQARIAQACTAHGRAPDSVCLLAVSKTFSAEAVAQAYAAGQRAFGENYIQEGVEKVQALAGLDIEWHCIGPIQSNKTRLVAAHFDWAQSVSSLRVAQRLSDQRPPERPPLQICLQVNIDGGANKSGLAPDEVLALAREVQGLPRLRLRGLMCIPEPAHGFDAQLRVHAQARALWDQLRAQGVDLDTLSLGMSEDLEAAVAVGSTMVRVGSAIFGRRLTAAAD